MEEDDDGDEQDNSYFYAAILDVGYSYN